MAVVAQGLAILVTAETGRIPDTKHVEDLWASEPLLPELLASGRVELLGEPWPIAGLGGMLVD